MPAHTHLRRMEAYFYFDVPESQRVFHFMGQPGETRHLVVGDCQGIISPTLVHPLRLRYQQLFLHLGHGRRKLYLYGYGPGRHPRSSIIELSWTSFNHNRYVSYPDACFKWEIRHRHRPVPLDHLRPAFLCHHHQLYGPPGHRYPEADIDRNIWLEQYNIRHDQRSLPILLRPLACFSSA